MEPRKQLNAPVKFRSFLVDNGVPEILPLFGAKAKKSLSGARACYSDDARARREGTVQHGLLRMEVAVLNSTIL